MKKQLFDRLVESMEQHTEIASGARAPSHEKYIDTVGVRTIREDDSVEPGEARNDP